MTFVMSSAAVLLPLSYHANYKLVTFWVCNIPVANEDVKMNKLHLIRVYHFCVKSFPHSCNVWNFLRSFSCQWLSRDGTAAIVILVLATDGHRFFRLLLSNCVNWKIYCDDHSSLSSTTAVQKWIISYTSHHRWYCLSVVFFLFMLFLCYFAVPIQEFSKEQWQVIITI